MKLLVRITVIFTALYFLAMEILAFFFDEQIVCDAYISLGELVICLLISEQGKYHCKYLKWIAWGILLSDALLRIDIAFEIIPTGLLWILLLSIIAASLVILLIFAIKHFVRVKRIKRYGVAGHYKGKV